MKIIIISNRLPVTVIEEDKKFTFKESSGGLVSGLSAYLDSLKSSSFAKSDYIWLGWPGASVSEKAKARVKSEMLSKFRAYPVFLTGREMDKFYLGFCNKTIWPLFHYFPAYVNYDDDFWTQYKQVNEMFCRAVLEIAKQDDVVWVHDYHLMLLPKLLREKIPGLSIGYFHHIPFPSFEIFRLLPSKWRSDLLSGLLGADLIGFHTQEYTQYFLRCVLRILGHEHDMGLINMTDHVVKADTFPMGIDFDKFHNARDIPEIKQQEDELKTELAKYRVILSIDRLDYTKGVVNRLRSYELFLEQNPAFRNKVVLVLVLVPSRIGVESYQLMKRQIDELVGKINGKFGDITWMPIIYQYKFLPYYPLLALYRVSDICLVTPLRDGMNLVAKEYVATRSDQSGVLILSEMAGAVKELGEAIIINPNSMEELTAALKQALEMPVDDQVRRNRIMQNRLKRYDVVRWAGDFIGELQTIKKIQSERFYAKLINPEIRNRLTGDFKKASSRLIYLDYDGTVVPFTVDPQKAKPTEAILTILKHVTAVQNLDMVMVSGRDRATLDDWLGKLNIGLVAEHGVWIREPGKDWQMIKPMLSDWKTKILPILGLHADRLPGSFVEEKEFSVVWHYRGADPELGVLRAKELMDELVEYTANMDIQILQGSKVIEVRNAGVNKGIAAMHFLTKKDYDFVMAIGDDWTDEDLFKSLPPKAYTIRVGVVASYALYNLRDFMEVRQLLEQLAR
jgi:trehalose 6-phosphate synthase/phosphatase